MSSAPGDEYEVAADLELLDLVRRGLDAVEPEPPHLRELAYAARFMATVEAELASLIYDSRHDADVLLRRGAENQARLLSFSNEHLTLDVSLAADGRWILGEIHPVLATELVVESREEVARSVPIDEFGRFRVESGATSIRLRVVGRLVTPWIDRR